MFSNPNLGLKKYYKNISSKKSDYDFEIEKDIERTFPLDKLFKRNSNYYKMMLSVLRATNHHLP